MLKSASFPQCKPFSSGYYLITNSSNITFSALWDGYNWYVQSTRIKDEDVIGFQYEDEEKDTSKNNDYIRPSHYGGEENPFEPIKIINHYSLNFSLGNAIKYILRAGRKTDSPLEDLEKAKQYIQFEIDRIKSNKDVK